MFGGASDATGLHNERLRDNMYNVPDRVRKKGVLGNVGASECVSNVQLRSGLRE